MPPKYTEEIDHMDELSDDLLLHILSYVPPDVHCLARCSAVSRRFRHLVPLVPSLRVRLNLYFYINTTRMFSFHCRLVCLFLFKPFLPLGTFASAPRFNPDYRYWAPVLSLNKFSNLRVLHLVIPFGEVTLNDTPLPASFSTLLRWRAHFGSSLNRCLILGAASYSSSAWTGSESVVLEGYRQECLSWHLAMSWTDISLFSSSLRHHKFRRIIMPHTNLESLVLTDVDGQGVIRMNKDQLKEMREKPPLVSYGRTTRTTIPDYRTWQWHSPVLKLSSGVVLMGATLIAVRPSSGIEKGKEEMRLGWIEEEFDGDEEGMYAEAVQMLVKGGRTHYAEFGSF